MNEGTEKYLIKLCDSKEQTHLETIKERFSQFPKYFFDARSNTLLIYDRTCVFILSKQEARVTDLGRVYPIAQLVYNPFRNILVFLTFDGELHAHFITHKSQIMIKNHVKTQILFDWVYERQMVEFFIADYTGVKMLKVDEDKKMFKEVKSVNAKYNSFLYDPLSQVLVGFPNGDCKTVFTFIFEESRSKNWFKGPQVPIKFDEDPELMAKVKKTKSLGIRNSRMHCELFVRDAHQDHAAEIIKMNGQNYLVLYFSNEGKLKLYPIAEESPSGQISIKLPSDSVPIFHVVDNMLVAHLRNEKITFIYDIVNQGAQMLVSPFPLEHQSRPEDNFYQGSFKARRHIMASGVVSKWVVNIPVIHYYLKNENQVFDFLLRRREGKVETLRWLRDNLTTLRQINLSRFWKMIFLKYLASDQENWDNISIGDLYVNIFSILVQGRMTPWDQLLTIILECIRQANQIKLKIPLDLQRLLLDMLLECRRHDLIVLLCHNELIRAYDEFARLLMDKGMNEGEEILVTLSIDMANRTCKPQLVFELLMLSQKVWEAMRYLKRNYEQIETPFMIYSAKLLKDPHLRKEYLRMTTLFLKRKFPSMDDRYLSQAEESVRMEVDRFARQGLR